MTPRKLRRILRLTNRRLRWIVGFALLGLVCIQCTRPSDAGFQDDGLVRSISGREVGELSDAQVQRLEVLARTDPIALLEQCRDHSAQTVRDYTCTFIKQERMDGVLGQVQEMRVKFLARPHSVAMHWTVNAPISDRVLYVEGSNDDQILLRPKGLLSWMGTVRRQPDSPQVMANTLRPITIFGFERSLESLIEVYRLASQRGELRTEFLGYRSVAGRPALVLSRELPPRDDYPAARTLTYIDPKLMAPIAFEAWDWDGQLSSRYIFKDIRINVGLTPDDFTPRANGL